MRFFQNSIFLSRYFHEWINSYTEKPKFIWFNSNIKVDSKPVHFFFFCDKNLFIGQFFNNNRNMKPWDDIKLEFHLKDTHKTS